MQIKMGTAIVFTNKKSIEASYRSPEGPVAGDLVEELFPHEPLTDDMWQQVGAAIQCHINRFIGQEHPIGALNADGDWRPCPETEEQECCREMMEWVWPDGDCSIITIREHCQTSAVHTAHLHNVDPTFFIMYFGEILRILGRHPNNPYRNNPHLTPEGDLP